YMSFFLFFFFFQAEDGIRDRNVTGVQTCALPILIHLLSFILCLLDFINVFIAKVPLSANKGNQSSNLCSIALIHSSSYSLISFSTIKEVISLNISYLLADVGFNISRISAPP